MDASAWLERRCNWSKQPEQLFSIALSLGADLDLAGAGWDAAMAVEDERLQQARRVREVRAAIAKARALSLEEESEEEPYKHKYAAAAVLATAVAAAGGTVPSAAAPLKEAAAQPAGCSNGEAAAQALSPPSMPPGAVDGGAATPTATAPTAATPTTTTAAAPNNSSTRAGPASASGPTPLDVAIAQAMVLRGVVLLETDLLHEGEVAVRSGLPSLEPDAAAHLPWLLEGYNSLGALQVIDGACACSIIT